MKRPLQLNIRLTKREMARFRRLAVHKDVSVAQMVRHLVKRAAEAAGVVDEPNEDPRQTSIEGA